MDVPSSTWHILRMSQYFPFKKLMPSCQRTHVHVHRLTHTHMRVPLSITNCVRGKEEVTGTNTYATLPPPRRQATHKTACSHMYIQTHVNPCLDPDIPHGGSKTQTLKTCLPLATLVCLLLHRPTGLHTYSSLPTNRGLCPHFPPTHLGLPQVAPPA